MRGVLKGIEYVQKTIVYLLAILIALLAIIVFYEVIARYGFRSPTIWTNEISSYILQFIVFFSMGYLLIEDEHLKVTFFLDKLKGKANKVLRIINVILVIPYAAILLIYGWNITASSFERGSVSPTLLSVPLWIPYSFICIGGGLLILAGIGNVLKIITEPNDATVKEAKLID
ncbi:TRAP transporter small permease subunit [Psychrobacillus lasiicapitis]|uniref:TRAP transporter small permease n=1 Tax=Psychrobacillus lasiicapitis TaxID=1636719 RepID=A0A544T2Y8_9BACI|nr:TRAP transporter small permease [Psychrobacillus lasiicapitis]TQR11820.1 TRAP transporter small permease [Psychrobacillus lasiicapitis]GGA19724.1 tripartite transporter small subunit [Psychrobacillus lasiicapitis]